MAYDRSWEAELPEGFIVLNEYGVITVVCKVCHSEWIYQLGRLELSAAVVNAGIHRAGCSGSTKEG